MWKTSRSCAPSSTGLRSPQIWRPAPGLLERLNRRRPLTLVSAPAGYGKTSQSF